MLPLLLHLLFWLPSKFLQVTRRTFLTDAQLKWSSLTQICWGQESQLEDDEGVQKLHFFARVLQPFFDLGWISLLTDGLGQAVFPFYRKKPAQFKNTCGFGSRIFSLTRVKIWIDDANLLLWGSSGHFAFSKFWGPSLDGSPGWICGKLRDPLFFTWKLLIILIIMPRKYGMCQYYDRASLLPLFPSSNFLFGDLYFYNELEVLFSNLVWRSGPVQQATSPDPVPTIRKMDIEPFAQVLSPMLLHLSTDQLNCPSPLTGIRNEKPGNGWTFLSLLCTKSESLLW